MKILKGEVLTNCTDDEFWRVKVKVPGYWEESEPIPAINSIYLEKGESVLILMEDITNPVILGRFFDYKQKEFNPEKGAPVVFQAKNGENWLVMTLLEGKLQIKTSGGSTVLLEDKSLSVETPDSVKEKTKDMTLEVENVTIKGTNIKVEGTDIKVDGTAIEIKGSVTHNGTAAPNGSGAWCGIPSCLFSGAPHVGNKTM